MEKFKMELISKMKSVVSSLNCCGNSEWVIAYSRELEALAKAYAALEGKNVTL